MCLKKYGGSFLFPMFGSSDASLANSESTHLRMSVWRVAVRGKVERMVRPSKRRTWRFTDLDCEGRDVVGGSGCVGVCASAFRSFSRSSLRASAWALRAALSASMRALTRARSSASCRFFFRNASRASCCAFVAAGLGVFEWEVVVAFCLPFALAEGAGAGSGSP
jgi:hypothetical protein